MRINQEKYEKNTKITWMQLKKMGIQDTIHLKELRNKKSAVGAALFLNKKY